MTILGVCTWFCGLWYGMYKAHEFGESCWNFCPCCFATSTMVLRHRMRERENIKVNMVIFKALPGIQYMLSVELSAMSPPNCKGPYKAIWLV